MKLQIKDSGAWRNLVTFTNHELACVQLAAALLLKALNQPKTVMRIAEGDTPIDWCEAPACTWRSQGPAVLPHQVSTTPAPVAAAVPAVPTPAQVEAAFIAAAYDIDVDPSDEEIVELLEATFGMSRCDVIRRIDRFNFVEVVSAHPMPVAA